jgi:hypothetical protein
MMEMGKGEGSVVAEKEEESEGETTGPKDEIVGCREWRWRIRSIEVNASIRDRLVILFGDGV